MQTYLITTDYVAQFMLRSDAIGWQASSDRGKTWAPVAAYGRRVYVARLAAAQLGLAGEITVVAPQPEVPVLHFPFGPGTATQP